MNSTANVTRKFRHVTDREYRTTVTDALRRTGWCAKRIARAAGGTTRSAQNWLAGVNAPNGSALLNLENHCEDIRVAMEKLKEMSRSDL